MQEWRSKRVDKRKMEDLGRRARGRENGGDKLRKVRRERSRRRRKGKYKVEG